MHTRHVVTFSALVLLLAAPACGGRSSLNDYENGAGLLRPVADGDGAGGDSADGDGADSAGVDGADGSEGTDGDGSDGSDDLGDGDGGDDGVTDQPVGAECESASNCEGGADAQCLTDVSVGGMMITFPDGYCSVTGCESDGDCPDGSGCFGGVGGVEPSCLVICDDEADCRDGYNCTPLGFISQTNASYCTPPFAGPGGGSGIPGGGGGNGSGGGGGFAEQICGFLCQDPDDRAACVASGGDFQNLPEGCMSGGGFPGGGGGFGN